MFAKLITVFGLLAIAAQVVVAVPPACVLAAVNEAEDPADIKAVCDNAKVKSYILSKCGNNIDTAYNYYGAVCQKAGVTVSPPPSSASGSQPTASPTKTLSGGGPAGTAGTAPSGFCTATTNGTWSAPTASGASGASATRTTGAGRAQSTGAASRLGMDTVGLAAVGMFGAMLAL